MKLSIRRSMTDFTFDLPSQCPLLPSTPSLNEYGAVQFDAPPRCLSCISLCIQHTCISGILTHVSSTLLFHPGHARVSNYMALDQLNDDIPFLKPDAADYQSIPSRC